MKTLFRCALLVAAVALSGCVASVVSSARAPALKAPIVSAKVVFAAAPLPADTAQLSAGAGLGAFATPYSFIHLAAQGAPSPDRLTADARAFGEHILLQFPSALRTAGVTVNDPVQIPKDIKEPPEFASLFGGSRGPVFVIKPTGATMNCPGSCFAFRLEISLLDEDFSKLLWSGTLDTPFPASRFDDYSIPATSFAEVLLKRLRKDGVVQEEPLSEDMLRDGRRRRF